MSLAFEARAMWWRSSPSMRGICQGSSRVLRRRGRSAMAGGVGGGGGRGGGWGGRGWGWGGRRGGGGRGGVGVGREGGWGVRRKGGSGGTSNIELRTSKLGTRGLRGRPSRRWRFLVCRRGLEPFVFRGGWFCRV